METGATPPRATPPNAPSRPADEASREPQRRSDHVEVSGSRVVLCLDIDDAALAEHIAGFPPEARPAEVAKVLAVGVRGIGAMSMTASVARVGEEVERVLTDVADVAEGRVSDLLAASEEVMLKNLDPAVKTSWSAQTILEINELHNELLARLDPSNRDGHTGRLIHEVQTLLGPGGLLERRLSEALDPTSNDSGLGRLQTVVEQRFVELRDAIVGDRARSAEAERGTAKGFDFEDQVEALLRAEAGRLGGCSVEATGTVAGALSAVTKVGDFVLNLPSGHRIVVEAKNASRIQLAGKGGILAELDEAMANRAADFGVCVAASVDAYPAEVGPLGVYGNRVLVADDGSGVTTRAALRWAVAAVVAASPKESSLDAAAMADGLRRIKELATRLSNLKRALATIRTGVDQVRNDLDGVRGELLDHVDELSRKLTHALDDVEPGRVA